MKKILPLTLAVLFLTAISSSWAEESALEKLIERITKEQLVVLAKEPVIVNAVKQANQEAVRSQDEIIALDKRWQQAEQADEWVNGFLNNPCAEYLRGVQRQAAKGERSLYAEIFVMDKHGCIVGETDKTSDYWQGDEDKFIESFADGKGAIFISESLFDESSERYLLSSASASLKEKRI